MNTDTSTWGVQINGFVAPTQQDVLARIEIDQRELIDPEFDTSADSPNGQNNGIFSRQAAMLWDAIRALNAAQSRSGAEGDLLTKIGELTGTVTNGPRPTIVTATCVLADGTFLEAGVDFAHIIDHPERQFTPAANYTAGYSGSHTLAFACTENGPLAVSANTLTVITTPKTGWSSITNAAIGVPGSDGDTDEQTRAAQEADLEKAGAGTAEALRVDVLALDGVIDCQVLENKEDYRDANGLPPHSVEVVVYADGTLDTAELARTIELGRSSGCQTYGTLTASFVDDAGVSRSVKYSVLTQIPIYVTYNLTVNSQYIGNTLAKDAIVADLAARFQAGETVNYLYVAGVPFHLGGAVEVNSCTLGTSPAPSGTVSVPMSSVRDQPTFDVARITITGV